MKLLNIILAMMIIAGCATKRELTPEQEYRISKGQLCIDNCKKNTQNQEDMLEYYSSETKIKKINLKMKEIEENK